MSEKNEKSRLSAKEAEALFTAYDKADAAWEKSKEETKKCFDARSEACQAIFDALGKGPFEYKGQELTVAKRGDTFFFRGKKKNQSVLKIG